MAKVSGISFLASCLVSVVCFAQGKPPVYTLIESIDYKTPNGLSCELAVVMSADHTHLKIARLDNRKGTYSVNYFAKSTHLFKNYGVQIDLDDFLNLGGAKIENIHAAFDLKDGHYDLILKVQTPDPVTGAEHWHERIFSLEQEFFKDAPKTCLK